ncbi:MAG TPA: hypothetical protein VIV12_04235 [Streptosporangiaceae bacterium]
MAWTDSRIFDQAVLNPLTASAWSTTEPTTYGANGLSADVINVALFDNGVVPDRSAVVGSTGYNTGTWLTANEKTDATNWVAGGRALASKTYSILAAGAVSFDAADLAGGGNMTITAPGAYGCLVYDNTITAGTVAKQGLCFNYFGGAQAVTAGTFTIIWDATGVFKFTT